MDINLSNDQVLSRFRAAAAKAYGARLERVVLFGSRARRNFSPDSDYDIAVFLHGMGDWWEELRPLGHITTDILVDTGAVISAKPFRAEAYPDDLLLMREIRRDGRDI